MQKPGHGRPFLSVRRSRTGRLLLPAISHPDLEAHVRAIPDARQFPGRRGWSVPDSVEARVVLRRIRELFAAMDRHPRGAVERQAGAIAAPAETVVDGVSAVGREGAVPGVDGGTGPEQPLRRALPPRVRQSVEAIPGAVALLDALEAELTLHRYSPRTRKAYVHHVGSLLRHVCVPAADLTPDHAA